MHGSRAPVPLHSLSCTVCGCSLLLQNGSYGSKALQGGNLHWVELPALICGSTRAPHPSLGMQGPREAPQQLPERKLSLEDSLP